MKNKIIPMKELASALGSHISYSFTYVLEV